MPRCTPDPVACIDWWFITVGNVLKNGYTMLALALTLIVLLRLRRRQQKAREAAYANALAAYEEKLTR